MYISQELSTVNAPPIPPSPRSAGSLGAAAAARHPRGFFDRHSMSMLPVSPNFVCPPPASPTTSSPSPLPKDVRGDIAKFQLEGYARKYFKTRKKGIFKRQVPIKDLLTFQKVHTDSATAAVGQCSSYTPRSCRKTWIVLCSTSRTSRSCTPSPSRCFNISSNPSFLPFVCCISFLLSSSLQHLHCSLTRTLILTYQGLKKPLRPTEEIATARELLQEALREGQIRDEIYCQICTQTCDTPSAYVSLRLSLVYLSGTLLPRELTSLTI